jgi:hypothetical protein
MQIAINWCVGVMSAGNNPTATAFRTAISRRRRIRILRGKWQNLPQTSRDPVAVLMAVRFQLLCIFRATHCKATCACMIMIINELCG